MIFKASKRSGGRQLGSHLLKTEENEHVEIHEVSGFISDSVMGAMNEAYAAARGTKCKQYLFSMSLRATHSRITSAQRHCRCMGLPDGEVFQNPQAE